jgi:hypothetical protein
MNLFMLLANSWVGFALGSVLLFVPLIYFFRMVGKAKRDDDEPKGPSAYSM